MLHKLLIFAFVFVAVVFFASSVTAVECGVIPTDHCTISLDTTFLPGTYAVGNITFVANSTTLNCNGARLIDSAPGLWLLNVGGTKDVVIKNCNITGHGFAISNYHALLGTRPVEHVTIRDNYFENGHTAVRIDGSFGLDQVVPAPALNHAIINNTVVNSNKGIMLLYSNNSRVVDNTLEVTGGPNYEGIYLAGSSHALVKGNTLKGGKIHAQRSRSSDSVNTTIHDNTLSNGPRGIELREGSDGADVRRNILTNVAQGMWIRSDNHMIRANAFEGSSLDSSHSGIMIDSATNPKNITVFLNFFEKMQEPVYDGGTNNQWHGTIRILNLNFTYGNFYDIFFNDSHGCLDANFDNICDRAFSFPVNKQDLYALRSKLTPSGTLAPIVAPIPDIHVNEVADVRVVINVTLAGENSTLSYAIKNRYGEPDPRFVAVPGKPNEFVWKTGLKDAGTYVFKAVATDQNNLNGGVDFNVFVNESDSNCKLYLPRIMSGCEVKEDTTFSPGNYAVPEGISIVADNVKLDCNGAVMDNQERDAVGISVINRRNVEIINCTVLKNLRGVVVDQSQNILVKSSLISDSTEEGIQALNSNALRFEGNTITKTQWGIRFTNVQNSHIYKNQIVANENGQIMFFAGTSYNNVTENTISSQGFNYPFRFLPGVSNNFIYRNTVADYPRSPLDQGTNNIWSVNGEGNYWSNHNCINNNWDSICENSYNFFIGQQDPHPFARKDGWKKPYPQITVSSTTPKLGQPMTIQLIDTDMANRPYLLALDTATTPGIALGDGRIINLAGSSLFLASLLYGPQLGFVHSGTFDSNGVATIAWNVPPLDWLHGWTFYVNVIPYDPEKTMPQTVLGTYRSIGVTLQR